MNLKQAAVAAVLVSATTACAALAGCAFDTSKNVVKPAETLEFQKINPAIAMAHAYGDRSKGSHGSFGTFPAEFITPMHTHSGAYHGVVIEGMMTNPFAGEASAPLMRPGSYWYVAAGAEHATACVSKTPCKFYFYADGAFDFTPTQ